MIIKYGNSHDKTVDTLRATLLGNTVTSKGGLLIRTGDRSIKDTKILPKYKDIAKVTHLAINEPKLN